MTPPPFSPFQNKDIVQFPIYSLLKSGCFFRADIEELLHAAEEMQKPSDANKPISTMASCELIFLWKCTIFLRILALHLFQQRRAFEHQKKLKSEGRKSINGLALDGGGVKGLLLIQVEISSFW